jgi:protein-S-isoprenylcysteine O-methyltransferase Ste14
MYLGMASVLLGVAVNHGTIVTFVFPILFIVLMEMLFIPMEEAILIQRYENEYRDYMKKVRRWL